VCGNGFKPSMAHEPCRRCIAWACGSCAVTWTSGPVACKPIIITRQMLPYPFFSKKNIDSTHVDSITICIYFEYMRFMYNSMRT
jgi:hypothetical protein